MPSKTHQIWNAQFISHIIDSMADGVFTLDDQGHITSWNFAMERISGYPADEALGKTCQLLQCSRCFGKQCPASIKKCAILEHGKSEAKECLLKHKDGHSVPVIKNASVVRGDDENIIGIVETLTDLTELNKARREAEQALLRLGEMHRMDKIIGRSHEMQKVFTAINAVAMSDATILIQGESGTGKELAAAAIHYRSERANYPLITVNCSALSESLLESELFGHIKGAYTGAIHDRTGRFEEADGGTVFLDEIGELSPLIQVKLLRVLQEREIERVGESKKRKINIRIIAATHQDLYHRVREGHFREDLYYRLKVFPIQLPPLWKRKEDIPLLVGHFIEKQNKKTGKNILGPSQHALRMLMDHTWPGNVRELENAIEHAFVLCTNDKIDCDDLPAEIRQSGSQPLFQGNSKPSVKTRSAGRNLSRENLLEMLEACDWNKAEVARRIGLSRTAVWKYMKKWEIPLQKQA